MSTIPNYITSTLLIALGTFGFVFYVFAFFPTRIRILKI
jgi:hypothetical protein